MTATTMTRVTAPPEGRFEADSDFLDAPDLESLAERLMKAEPMRFGMLADVRVSYLWKKKGGTSRGQLKKGMTKKATGDLKHFSMQDAIIWLAADHHAWQSERQIEATLYHELLHLLVDEDDGKLKLVGHDFEGFAAEVVKYGDVLSNAQAIAPAFRQLAMFDGER